MLVEKGDPAALPVIFIHGFPFSHQDVGCAGGSTQPVYRTIAYDVRGLGESSLGDGQYTIEGHVDDLLAVMDHFGIAKAVIAGLSMGGYITLRALERNPERFHAAILCDTRSEADGNEGKIMRARTMAAVKSRGSSWFADDFMHEGLRGGVVHARPRGRRAHPHHHRADAAPGDRRNAARACGTDRHDGSLPSTITVPTLIIVGEHDATTPPDASRAMHAKIPGSELHIIPDAAHMSAMENPDEVNRRILEFLHRLA